MATGQKYTFAYGGTYGELNRMTFPGGGYVRYLWGPNSLSAATFQQYYLADFTVNKLRVINRSVGPIPIAR